MKKLRLVLVLILSLTSSLWAAETSLPPELHGILATGRDHRFALLTPAGEYSGWVTVGATVGGWKISEFLPKQEALVLTCDGRTATVRLNRSVVGNTEATSKAMPATLADAEAVLNRMNFEAFWDRTAAEQKKGMIAAMRQQAAPEFTRAGLTQAEIDPLLEKMGDAIVAGMQTDAMREDFARAFTEVYTQDELRGMAAFYETAAGKAWADKQPLVQEKLMQAMMPRVMQGMPAAQKIAADYMLRRGGAAPK